MPRRLLAYAVFVVGFGALGIGAIAGLESFNRRTPKEIKMQLVDSKAFDEQLKRDYIYGLAKSSCREIIRGERVTKLIAQGYSLRTAKALAAQDPIVDEDVERFARAVSIGSVTSSQTIKKGF